MKGDSENKDFDISRRDGVAFKHYQILVKLFYNEHTEQHNVDVFTTGPDQLTEMRRIYAKTYKQPVSGSIYRVMKNN